MHLNRRQFSAALLASPLVLAFQFPDLGDSPRSADEIMSQLKAWSLEMNHHHFRGGNKAWREIMDFLPPHARFYHTGFFEENLAVYGHAFVRDPKLGDWETRAVA